MYGGYRMAWVGFAEDDENKTVLPVACAGYDQGYLDQAKITWADTERGRGPTGTAIRTGKISYFTKRSVKSCLRTLALGGDQKRLRFFHRVTVDRGEECHRDAYNLCFGT